MFSLYSRNRSRHLCGRLSLLAGASLGRCLQLRAAGVRWALLGGVVGLGHGFGWAASFLGGGSRFIDFISPQSEEDFMARRNEVESILKKNSDWIWDWSSRPENVPPAK